MPKITNVEVSRTGEHADYALSWESGGFRYHVWLDSDYKVTHGVGIMGPTVFKNPPLGVKRGDTDHFTTRYLKLSIPKNKAMFDDAMAEAVAGHLFEKNLADLLEAEQKRLAGAAAAYKIEQAKEAGPNMLRVLKAIDDYWSDRMNQNPLNPYAQITDRDEETIADAVRAAIAEAEGKV